MNHHQPYHIPAASVAVVQTLPAGIDPESVRSRQIAMIEAGTHAMIAEKLAMDATQNQLMRERHPKFVSGETTEITAEPIA